MSHEQHDYMDEFERIAAEAYLHNNKPESPIRDPEKFANEAQLLIGYHSEFTNDWIYAICPEEHAAERRALHEAGQHQAAIPAPARQALERYQERLFELAIALYDAGVKHGAAYEHLRRSVVGEVSMCWPCHGVGAMKNGETCGECGGTGTVARRS